MLEFEILKQPGDAVPEEPEVERGPEVHPFDDPELVEVLTETYGISKDVLDKAVRPGFSANVVTNTRECADGEALLSRKRPLPGEGDEPFARRVLYEEIFAAVGAVTPGGLASHGYPTSYLNSKPVDIEQRARSEIFAPPSSDHLSLDERRLLEHLGSVTAHREGAGFMYRTLHMLHIVPEMSEAANRKLVELFVPEQRLGVHQPVSRTELIYYAWGQGRIFFNDHGYRPDIEDDPQVIAATHNLALLRTHPDMQIFFKYLSPDGYDADVTQTVL